MSTSITDRRGDRRDHKVGQPGSAPVAEDPVVAGVVGAVSQAERQQLSWSRVVQGSETEEVTTSSLEILGRFGWTSLHEARWPGLPDVQNMHVAIGPGGVVVVAERSWTGNVAVEGDVLRHNGFRCDRDLEQIQAAFGAVTALLAPEHRDAVSGVIHVTPRDMPPIAAAGIWVVGRMHLATMLVDLPQRLTPMQVGDIARWLTRAIESPVTTVAASGAGAVSGGGVFYPSNFEGSDAAAYFSPARRLPARAFEPEHDENSWPESYLARHRYGRL